MEGVTQREKSGLMAGALYPDHGQRSVRRFFLAPIARFFSIR
jgi:hypothetical protein